ncbi:MAG: SRPBCC family protein [Steroidobacteraceae bacterium]
MSTQKGSASRSSTVIERTYRARVEELWDLWATKEGFESWWGSAGSRVEVHIIEAREGGALHYDMIAVASADIATRKEMDLPPSSSVRARFTEFRPYQRLILAHVIDFVPGVKPYQQAIAVDFFPAGDTVRMVTTIEPLHNEEFTRTSIRVFTGQLERLEERFQRRESQRRGRSSA